MKTDKEAAASYYKNLTNDQLDSNSYFVNIINAFEAGCKHKEESRWIPVTENPLVEYDERGNWVCTKVGMEQFMAAVPYEDKNRPGENLWWIRHCVIEDETGLCVVDDYFNEPAGWSIEDVTHYQLIFTPPQTNK